MLNLALERERERERVGIINDKVELISLIIMKNTIN